MTYSRQRVLSAGLVWLMVVQGICSLLIAQESNAELLVLAGENFVVEPGTAQNWEVAVQFQHRDGRKIAGANVVFQIPSGVGTFLNGSSFITAVTDQDGIARVRGFRPSRRAGAFVIFATASSQGVTASVSIHQSIASVAVLSAPVRGLIIGSVVAGVGAWVGYSLTRKQSPTAVTLGRGTVAPQ